MAEYIERDAACDDCNNQNICADKTKCPVGRAVAADVVEVVRCKNCSHGRKIDKKKAPEKYFKEDCIVCECEDVVGDEHMIYLPHHFCSYGERRTEDGG